MSRAGEQQREPHPMWIEALVDVAEIIAGNPLPPICREDAQEQPAKVERHLRFVPHRKRGDE